MKFLICIGILLTSNNLLFSQANDTIYWTSHYRLQWNDFRGSPDTSLPYAAVTESGIQYSYYFDDSTFSFKVYSFFDKIQSWTRRNDSANLNHEQLHFDITEIFARKIRAALSQIKPARLTIRSDVKHIVEKLIAEKEEMQNQYDLETHLLNEKQAYWNQKIRALLAESSSFRATDFSLPLRVL